jgi:hypothetical protein
MTGKAVPTRPVSIRLTEAERRRFAIEAGSAPLSVHLRARLLEGTGLRRSESHFRYVDFARLLSQLGQSNLGSNLADLAEAARSGGLPVNPDTESALNEACAAVIAMRSELLLALGLRKA